jgi:hypothetical protein
VWIIPTEFSCGRWQYHTSLVYMNQRDISLGTLYCLATRRSDRTRFALSDITSLWNYCSWWVTAMSNTCRLLTVTDYTWLITMWLRQRSHSMVSLPYNAIQDRGFRSGPYNIRPPLWSSGQSSWLQNADVLCFLWGTNWIYMLSRKKERLPL